MRFLFTGTLHLIDESPIVFSARKAYFRVGAGSPSADRFHVRSLRRIRLLIRKSDELSANNGICLFASIPHKEDALPGMRAKGIILVLTHPARQSLALCSAPPSLVFLRNAKEGKIEDQLKLALLNNFALRNF